MWEFQTAIFRLFGNTPFPAPPYPPFDAAIVQCLLDDANLNGPNWKAKCGDKVAAVYLVDLALTGQIWSLMAQPQLIFLEVPCPCTSLGDYVWEDTNGNGIQDEPASNGVNGVTVRLLDCNNSPVLDSSGNEMVMVTADDDLGNPGYYLFPNLLPGCYRVQFDLPSGYGFTTKNSAGSTIENDSNPDSGSGLTDNISLAYGQQDLTIDAGLVRLASIGDRVFDDTNANGVQDPGEMGVDGVTVQLFNCVGDVLVGTKVTTGGGLYGFVVPPGDYYVKFSNLPAGYVFSPSTPGGASDPNDSDADPATGIASCTTLDGGESDQTWDAGIYQPAMIGDRVFDDTNANGVQDPGETGVDGVTVQLFNCVGDVLVGTKVTTGGGLYGFVVPPGDYYVKFSNLPPGYVFSPSTPGGASDPNDSDADPLTGATDCTTLVGGENDPTWDAGIYQPAMIGDRVFDDTNANGVQDPGEMGVDGVTVQLFNCVGDVLVGTKVTAGGGLYGFTVPPGDYYVKFSNLPAGYVFSPSTPGGASDPDDSDADPLTGATDCTTLVGGENDPTWDAGIYQPASIGNFVWNDLDADGIQDAGEPGVPNVTVQLLDCQGNVLDTTTTDADGFYGFTGLRPGDYNIRVSAPAGFLFTLADQGGNDALDSDANAGGSMVCTTLVSGENDLTWDAGLVVSNPTNCLVLYKTASTNTVIAGGSVTYTYIASNACLTTLTGVVVTDDNGTPDFVSDDFIVGTVPSLAPGEAATFTKTLILPVVLCLPDKNGVIGESGMLLTEILTNGDIKATFIQYTAINDNTYGANAIGWPGGHTFGNLTGSDKAVWSFRDANGVEVLNFDQDYITSSGAFPSGFGTLGVSGGDGGMNVGSAANVLAVGTSLTDNLNKQPFLGALAQYTVNSPSLADPNSAQWEYRMIYTVVINKAAFGTAGFGTVMITDQHNSPTKPPFERGPLPTACGNCVTNIARVTALSGTTTLDASATATVCVTGTTPPGDDCGECEGKVTQLTLRYDGTQAALVVVTMKKPATQVFSALVQPGELFTVNGADDKGTLSTEITIYVNGSVNTAIHTSCSQPIGPGQVYGAFTITDGYSKEGGRLCPQTPTNNPDCGECEGKVTQLTLRYDGTQAALVVVTMKKPATQVFSALVQPGELFTVNGADDKGTLSTEITIYVNGSVNTAIHTSCSQPIGPGQVYGAFTITDGYSKEGGRLCPQTPTNNPDCGECEGKVTQLTLRYDGTQAALVVVTMKKPATQVFSALVQPGELFTVNGADDKGTLSTEITIYVNGSVNTAIHTSCSQPIGPGQVYGAFTITDGYSKEGGRLCAVSGGGGGSDKDKDKKEKDKKKK